LSAYAWNEQGKIRGEFTYTREFQRVGGTHNQGHLRIAIPTMGRQEGYPFIKWQLPTKGRLSCGGKRLPIRIRYVHFKPL
jgi:hypothetical protein